MRIAAIIFGLLVLIQFIPLNKNDGAANQQGDIFNVYPASDSVMAIVKRSCYDCHSNHTTYPWYSNLQPVGLWLNHHVKEGKEELNFSEFKSYPSKKAKHKLEEVIDQVNGGKMPLKSYLLIHKDAVLNETQRKAIVTWADMAINSTR